MSAHEKINYLECPSRDLTATKQFFLAVFGWRFIDYGPEYTAFSNEGLDGGFFHSDRVVQAADGGALVVFYSESLENTLAKVIAAGGTITKPVFAFPGGLRFHFVEPGGNEFAVWANPTA